MCMLYAIMLALRDFRRQADICLTEDYTRLCTSHRTDCFSTYISTCMYTVTSHFSVSIPSPASMPFAQWMPGFDGIAYGHAFRFKVHGRMDLGADDAHMAILLTLEQIDADLEHVAGISVRSDGPAYVSDGLSEFI